MSRKPKPVEDNTGTDKNEYYDILTTEDCFIDFITNDDAVAEDEAFKRIEERQKNK